MVSVTASHQIGPGSNPTPAKLFFSTFFFLINFVALCEFTSFIYASLHYIQHIIDGVNKNIFFNFFFLLLNVILLMNE